MIYHIKKYIIKLVNYVYNNSITFRDLVWRFFVLSLVIGVVSSIVLYILGVKYVGSESMISNFKTTELVQKIGQIADFFSGSNYMKYTISEGFTTNKSGMLYNANGNIIEINLSGDANRQYDSGKKGFGITNKNIYLNNNGKTQIVSWSGLISGFINIGIELGALNFYIDGLFTGTNIISGDVFYIGSKESKTLVKNINFTLQNPNFYTKAKSDISHILVIGYIMILIILFIFLIILLAIYMIIFILYTLITWAILFIMGSEKTFEKAVSISRIPFIFKEIIQIAFGFTFLIAIIIFIIMIVIIIYFYNKKNLSKDKAILSQK